MQAAHAAGVAGEAVRDRRRAEAAAVWSRSNRRWRLRLWRAARLAPQRAAGGFWVESPDHKLKAFYRNRNLWIAILRSNEKAISTEGSEKGRIKYGTVAGFMARNLPRPPRSGGRPIAREGRRYRFDESQVKDFTCK